jgi:PEGA domain-containing protein
MRERWILTAAVAAAAAVALATTARAQAAAEYGVAASHSAGAAAKVGTKLGDALNRQNNQTASKLANVRESRIGDNRRGLEAKAGETPGKLHIESTPDKGTVYVDGVAVAYTPADLKLSPGAHRIEIAHAGFFNLKKEITVQRGDNPALKAALESEYKSELKLTIQK